MPQQTNLLALDNARNMSPEETIESFVVNDIYRKLISPENSIVLGSRGSGKTQLLKMLSFGFMRKLSEDDLATLPDLGSFIGVYVAFSSVWVGDLKSKPWRNDEEKEYAFCWRLNVGACAALLDCAAAIIDEVESDNSERARLEIGLVRGLQERWFDKPFNQARSLSDLKGMLRRYDSQRQASEKKNYVLHGSILSVENSVSAFDADLFQPLKDGIDVIERVLDSIGRPTWAVCLDEAEFLDESYQRIINTHMRSHSERLCFKLSTLPYGHYTLETNTACGISVGHDFSYYYIDAESSSRSGQDAYKIFAERLLRKRIQSSSAIPLEQFDLDTIFGNSDLVGENDSVLSDEQFESLLDMYANDTTKNRADRLRGEPQYSNSIVRKMRGALVLKDARENRKGREKPPLYYGTSVFLRCTDANPRRLIELFNRFVREIEKAGSFPLDKRIQNSTIRKFSNDVLKRVAGEQGCGKKLHSFLESSCRYMERSFEGKISSDYAYSIKVREDDPDEYIELIKRAVDLSYLYPNESSEPEFIRDFGVFHIAYVLAPQFYLLPRKGSNVRLTSIVSEMNGGGTHTGLANQTSLFEEAEG